jgi:hypothetical protein
MRSSGARQHDEADTTAAVFKWVEGARGGPREEEPRMRRVLATLGLGALAVLGLAAGFASSSLASESGTVGSAPHKVFVCKYVGKPGVDERLQTGNNPISVAASSIPDYVEGMDRNPLVGSGDAGHRADRSVDAADEDDEEAGCEEAGCREAGCQDPADDSQEGGRRRVRPGKAHAGVHPVIAAVSAMRVIDPTDVWPIRMHPTVQRLVLTACHPRRRDLHRLIVFAGLVDVDGA